MTNEAETNGTDARGLALDEVRIESPCPMKWAELEGGERKRYCGSCSLHVVNLSAMTRDEGQAFLDESVDESRVCVTYSKRPDGSLVTRPSAPLLARVGPIRRFAQIAASLLIGAFPLLAACRPAAKLGGIECTPKTGVDGKAPATDPGAGGGPVEMLGEVALPEPELLQETGDIAIVGRLAAPDGVHDAQAPSDETPLDPERE